MSVRDSPKKKEIKRREMEGELRRIKGRLRLQRELVSTRSRSPTVGTKEATFLQEKGRFETKSIQSFGNTDLFFSYM